VDRVVTAIVSGMKRNTVGSISLVYLHGTRKFTSARSSGALMEPFTNLLRKLGFAKTLLSERVVSFK
jgi:hypothetical protein